MRILKTAHFLKKITTSLFLFFIALNKLTFAVQSTTEFTHISLKEGLSNSVVMDIFQDKEGYLWIGTQDGLNRFNGYEFKHFRYSENDTTSIANNYIIDIEQDQGGNLWFATNGGGLSKYDKFTESFINFSDQNLLKLKENFISDITADTSGNLWIGYLSSGFAKFNIERGEITNYSNELLKFSQLTSNSITKLVFSKNGNFIWVGTQDGLFIYEIDYDRLLELNSYLFINGYSSRYIRSILIAKDSKIFIGTDSEGLFQIDNFILPSLLSKIGVKNYKYNPNNSNSISGNSINDLYETDKGDLVIGVWGGGVCQLKRNSRNEAITFNRIKHNKKNKKSLSSNDIITIYQDRSKVIWIGTYGGGLNKLSPNTQNFHYVEDNLFSSDNYNIHNVTSILKDNSGNLWIGSWSGLIKYNSITNRVKSYTEENSNLSSNRINSIVQDNQGYIWIGTLDGGLNRLNAKTENFKSYKVNTQNTNSITDNDIMSLLVTKKQQLWIGTISNGLDIYDLKSNQFFKPYFHQMKNNSEAARRVYSLYEDRDSNVWIGAYDGLYLYKSREQKFTLVADDVNTKSAFFNSRITSFAQTKNGDLWIGSFGMGLLKLKYNENNSSIDYKISKGLSNEFIHSLAIDNQENVWASTNKGIIKISNGNQTQIFGKYEGLRIAEFKDGGYFDSNLNEIYFGSSGGIVSFNPSSIKIEYTEPELVFESFNVLSNSINRDREIEIQKQLINGNIKLQYTENSFSLVFTALNYVAPEAMVYQFKLSGVDKSLQEVDSKHRTLTYSNLSPGEYELIVKAKINENIETNVSKRILITIIPPFWATVWFRIIASLLLVGILVSFFIIRTNILKRHNIKLESEVIQRTKTLEELNKNKDRFFSIIAHDLKGPFSYLLNNSEFLIKEIDTLSSEDIKSLASNINMSATNVYNLLENLLQWSKLQMVGIEPNYQLVNLNLVIDEVVNLLWKSAEEKRIKIIKPAKLQKPVLSDTNILTTVIRNLISNAIKFTKGKGKISILVHLFEDHFTITIEDTGIGMTLDQIDKIFEKSSNKSQTGTANEKGTGMGLVLCKDFVEAISGELLVKSKLGQGTKVVCKFPIPTPKI